MPDVEIIYRPVEYQKSTDFYETLASETRQKDKEDIKQSNISHAWKNLVKLYSDDDKYTGSVDENSKLKICIFNRNCELAGVSLEDRNKVFRVMLKENELRPSIEYIFESLKAHFEGSEQKSAKLARWNAIS
ncbi:hypothetical protein Golomagni_03831 [Golovinomyces magnicellulatus]|nr:hypothetical protein Golomagni_03831 [Golovinomyces magnicellulatus]